MALPGLGIDLPGLPGGPIWNPGSKPAEKIKLSDLVVEAGWAGNEARTATAVILAESGGDPEARSWCCTGLMQVHYIHAATFARMFGAPKEREAFRKWLENPRNNLKAAKKLYDDSKWRPWDVCDRTPNCTSGSALSHIGQDKEITVGKGGPPGLLEDAKGAVEAVSALNPASAIKQLAEVISKLFDPSFWLRAGKVWGGWILILLGVGSLLVILLKPLVGSAANVATTVHPAGRATKALKTAKKVL